jgi:DUF2934 family protein
MVTKSKPSANSDAPEAAAGTRAAPPAADESSTKPARSRNSRAQGQEATVSEDELRAMIEREAYLRAERRGFEPGHEEEDWLAAEAQVRSTLRRAGPQKH